MACRPSRRRPRSCPAAAGQDAAEDFHRGSGRRRRAGGAGARHRRFRRRSRLRRHRPGGIRSCPSRRSRRWRRDTLTRELFRGACLVDRAVRVRRRERAGDLEMALGLGEPRRASRPMPLRRDSMTRRAIDAARGDGHGPVRPWRAGAGAPPGRAGRRRALRPRRRRPGRRAGAPRGQPVAASRAPREPRPRAAGPRRAGGDLERRFAASVASSAVATFRGRGLDLAPVPSPPRRRLGGKLIDGVEQLGRARSPRPAPAERQFARRVGRSRGLRRPGRAPLSLPRRASGPPRRSRRPGRDRRPRSGRGRRGCRHRRQSRLQGAQRLAQLHDDVGRVPLEVAEGLEAGHLLVGQRLRAATAADDLAEHPLFGRLVLGDRIVELLAIVNAAASSAAAGRSRSGTARPRPA